MPPLEQYPSIVFWACFVSLGFHTVTESHCLSYVVAR